MNPQNIPKEWLCKFRDWNITSWNRTYGIDKHKLLAIYFLVFMPLLFLFMPQSKKNITELHAKYQLEIGQLRQSNEELKIKYQSEIDKLQQTNEELIKNNNKHIALLENKFKIQKMKLKMEAKAKAKIQRGIFLIPVINLAAWAAIEKLEFDDWKIDHPEGTAEEYAHEVYDTSQKLLSEEYHFLGKYAGQISESLQKMLN